MFDLVRLSYRDAYDELGFAVPKQGLKPAARDFRTEQLFPRFARNSPEDLLSGGARAAMGRLERGFVPGQGGMASDCQREG